MEEASPKKSRPDSLIKAQERYENSELGRGRMARYDQSEKGRERRRRYAANMSEEVKARQRECRRLWRERKRLERKGLLPDKNLEQEQA